MELRVEKNIMSYVAAVVVGIAITGLGYAGYSYYRDSKSAQAHAVFMQQYGAFEKLTADKTNLSTIKELADAVSRDYSAYKNSAYGPFFLALESEIQQIQGDNQKALDAMEKAVAEMSSVDPVLYYTYATKLALMQIDATEPATQTKGRQSLEKLAMNSKNPVKDMAWFYMGYQAYIDKDEQGVQVAWSKLFDAQKNPLSIWGFRAQSLLNYSA